MSEVGSVPGKQAAASSEKKQGTISGRSKGAVGKRDLAVTGNDNRKYGWGSFHPDWLQGMNSPWFLLVCLCYLAVVQGFVINGIVNAISPQLERRFHMITDEIGLLSSIYDVSQLAMMFPISYWGSKSHKGRWIGLCTIVMGVGSFVWSIPHFSAGDYNYFGASQSASCSNTTNTTSLDYNKHSSLRNWKYMFMFGQILHGIGASPLYTLAITYIDENVSQRTSTLFVGIFHACSLLGPTLGYLFSGWSLTICGEVDRLDCSTIPMQKDDPRWYGAWWIGMLVAAGLAWFVVPFLLGFSQQLPGAEQSRMHDVNQQHQVTVEDHAHAVEAFQSFATVRHQVWILLRNPTYMGLVLEQVTTMCVTAGVSMFLTKYIETQYSTTTSLATLLAAGAAIPSAFVGTLVGTIIQRVMHLHCYGNLILAIISSIGATVSSLAFFAWCPKTAFAGATVPYPVDYGTNVPKMTMGLDHTCNRGCGCTKSFYEPSCFKPNNTLFFSPCFAGCSYANKTVGVNCDCVNGESIDLGLCESKCAGYNLALFLLGLGVLILFVYVKQNPVVQATLRCVPFHLRTFALASAWVPIRLLGAIPSTPTVGGIIKATCIEWQESHGVQEVCVVYDNPNLATYVQVFSVVGFLIGLIALLVAWRLYVPPPTGEPIHVSEKSLLEATFQASPTETAGITKL